MASMLDSLLSQLGGDSLGGLAGILGADNDATGSAVSAALPAMMAALANNAGQDGGADALLGALDNHDGSALDQASAGQFDAIDTEDGSKIVNHMFGSRKDEVASNISKHSGLDLGSVMKLLPVLAPLLMGMLGKMKQSQGLSADGLSSMLDGEKQEAKAKPGLGGLLGMLDFDKDGNPLNDLMGLAGKVAGGGTSSGGGMLGKLMGMFRKR